MTAALLAIRFALELCVLAALAAWGAQAGDSTGAHVALAIATPVMAAAAWGLLAAPQSERRLRDPARLLFELFVFAGAGAALAAAGHGRLAWALGVAGAAVAVLLRAAER